MDETYLLLLLSDSNLPTGSFVASSGLESFLKHGFGAPPLNQPSASLKLDAIATFIRDSLSTYAPSVLPFVSDVHIAVTELRSAEIDREKSLAATRELDELYECMTLNHVARRASKAQGVALLSLYSKGFSKPPGSTYVVPESSNDDLEAISSLVDELKLRVRRGDRGAHGHLPVCWGVLCAALGLSLERTQHLHLYLHARSLLSAAVRLNSIGPYAAQQLLLHVVSAFVDEEMRKCVRLRTGVLLAKDGSTQWDETQDGPVNTWPLGEILAARHDLQHSRIFNS
ncbi:UreF-domain-containing protein [Mycena sanguinolenta]|nr:UreF-domain-containing protein [Mycena sanguinolenta]